MKKYSIHLRKVTKSSQLGDEVEPQGLSRNFLGGKRSRRIAEQT